MTAAAKAHALCGLGMVLLLHAIVLWLPALIVAEHKQPNFVLVLLDDMDLMMNSSHRAWLPRTWQHVADQGTVFNNMVVSMAWCCPSRVSLLTGKVVHNSNITSSKPPHGGATKFLKEEMDLDYLPVWLQQRGYRTYFTGKFLNGVTQEMLQHRCPRGWTTYEGLIDGNKGYREWYYQPVFSANCQGSWSPNGTYHQTDIIRDKGLAYIDDAAAAGKPFFIELAPTSPHTQGKGHVAVPALRHADLYKAYSMPKPPNWREPLPSIMGMHDCKDDTDCHPDFIDSRYIPRLQTLAGVDEMMEALVQRLDHHHLLDSTYIIFTSDNGYHLGHHGLKHQKFTPYEEDVRVPLFIRGPGVPQGAHTDYQATMVDLPATILSLAGGEVSESMDGTPLPAELLGLGPSSAYPPCPSSMSTQGGQTAGLHAGQMVSNLPCHAAAAVLPRLAQQPSSFKGVDGTRRSGGGLVTITRLTAITVRREPMRRLARWARAVGAAYKRAVSGDIKGLRLGWGWGGRGANGEDRRKESEGERRSREETEEESLFGEEPWEEWDDSTGARLSNEGPSEVGPFSAVRETPASGVASKAAEGAGQRMGDVCEGCVPAPGKHEGRIRREGAGLGSVEEQGSLRGGDAGDADGTAGVGEPPSLQGQAPKGLSKGGRGADDRRLWSVKAVEMGEGDVGEGAEAAQRRRLALAGGDGRVSVRGAEPSSRAGCPATPGWRDSILIEGWLDVRMHIYFRKNYRAVRVCSPVYVFGRSDTYQGMTCYKYTVWCIPSNRYNPLPALTWNELYDLGLDPYELRNRINATAGNPLASRLVDRLDAVLTALSYCRGSSCRYPWHVLHPNGQVSSLKQAMNHAYDDFYASLPKFRFLMCDRKYDPANEVADASIIARSRGDDEQDNLLG